VRQELEQVLDESRRTLTPEEYARVAAHIARNLRQIDEQAQLRSLTRLTGTTPAETRANARAWLALHEGVAGLAANDPRDEEEDTGG
jgi:hypothetical protein